jgi:7-carboxy-7-deazaguanine synthase
MSFRTEHTPGIYGIHHIPSDTWYVGQSMGIANRVYDHILALERRGHTNHLLQRLWDTSPHEAFEFLVLEVCDIDTLLEKEGEWIDRLDSLENGLNILPARLGSTKPLTYREYMQEVARRVQESWHPRSRIRNAEDNRNLSEVRKMQTNVNTSGFSRGYTPEVREKSRQARLAYWEQRHELGLGKAKEYLAVNEIFGEVFQGEGVSTGQICRFLRVSGCPLSCVWCDSAQTWDFTRFDRTREVHRLDVQDVLRRVLKIPGKSRFLVISGGEPAVQWKKLAPIASYLRVRDWRVEVETAGTVFPQGETFGVNLWTVSPKLAHSGNPLERRYKPEVLRAFVDLPSVFKFVVQSPSDFPELDAIVETFEIPHDRVWVMPEGVTVDAVCDTARLIYDDTVRRRYNLTLRQHINLWGNKRGT